MGLMKRATKQLHKAGVNSNIEIHKRLWGYAIEDRRYQAQQGQVYDTVQEAVNAVLSGVRPRRIWTRKEIEDQLVGDKLPTE